MHLEEARHRRRSVRDFADRTVADPTLRSVLAAAQGPTADGRRSTPSAAGRYPLHLVVTRGPEPAGTWTWQPDASALEPRSTADVRSDLATAGIGEQPWIADAPVTVIVCADTAGMLDHFADQPPGDRGRRYVDVEVGAAVQNLALQCVAEGLGGVIVGGFDDAVVADLLDLRGVEPRLLFCLGHPA